jgi:hypothetical protein
MAPPLSAQVFVYYRVRAEHRIEAATALRALHTKWRASDPGLGCELLQRVDDGRDRDGAVTLMEVYRHPDGVSPTWQQRIEVEARAVLAPWLIDERHVEVFAPCA